MDRIIAGIVLFKPEKERLKNCIEAIIGLELNIIVLIMLVIVKSWFLNMVNE